MAGITPTGFEAKTLEEILSEIETEERANISASLNTSAASPIGQLNGIIASKLRELWELAQAAYEAFNPNAASGASLTSLSLVTGTQREAATKSQVLADVTLAAGVYAPGSLIASVTGNPSARFVNVNSITSPGGVNAGQLFEAEETGPVQALAGTLTVIAEPVVGWTAVTNPADAEEGEDVETDVALRIRREQELAQAGSSTVDAIRADVLEVEGVQSCTVFENTTLVTDVNGLPGKAFEAVVFDGVVPAADDDAIAQAIWETKPAGIQAYGSDSGVAEDTQGVDHTINFTRVTVLNVYLDLFLTKNPDTYAGDAAVEAAVVAFGDSELQIGGDIILSRIVAAIFQVPGVVDVTSIEAGFAPAPVGTVNLVVGPREIGDLDTSRITVTSVDA